MNYKDFELIDFVLDESFQRWALTPTSDTDEYWKSWIRQNSEMEKVIFQAKAIINNIDFKKSKINETDKENIRNCAKARILAAELTNELEIYNDEVCNDYDDMDETAIHSLQSKKRKSKIWYRIAAVFTLLMVAGSVTFLSDYFDFERSEKKSSVNYLVKHNNQGEKSTLFLSDGSKVILNAASKISLVQPFDENQREIFLEGEAFFEVVKDEKRPFRVISDNISTTALGTSFNVSAYSFHKNIRVSLASGSVKVECDNGSSAGFKSDILNPGEESVFAKDEKTFSKIPFNPEEVLAWKDGIIYFKHADESTVVNKLELWYGVDINTNEKGLKSWDISATFNNESLENVLRTLSYTIGFDFTIDKKQVFIEF